ncbi:hypothetical protein SeLEV6574_g08206 [Synchytrium endobioticum]|uniref:Uncharacterized protein n=1 Tax=Synchytrium endobioticum TaxID=286115 RepID=A0A507C7R5_9FUNG|nr:hypothetical protein SeLEV6574_g08206 [Synchytrium endobioticum]
MKPHRSRTQIFRHLSTSQYDISMKSTLIAIVVSAAAAMGTAQEQGQSAPSISPTPMPNIGTHPQQEMTDESIHPAMHVAQGGQQGPPPGEGPESEFMHAAGGYGGGYTPYAYGLGNYANNFGLARKQFGVGSNNVVGHIMELELETLQTLVPLAVALDSGYGTLYKHNTHAFGAKNVIGNNNYYNAYAAAPYGGYGGYGGYF